jgi:hypothetical protein
MKKLLFTIASFTIGSIAMAQTPATAKKVSDVAQFKSETIELGKIKQSNPTSAIFEVTNVSKEPLIIETANPTCGCTISDYTKSPIAPGKLGEVKATYNAANLGAFTKTLTVKFAGVDELKSITIKGEVLSADDFAKLPVGAAAAAPGVAKSGAVVAKPVPANETPISVKGVKLDKSKKAVVAPAKKDKS